MIPPADRIRLLLVDDNAADRELAEEAAREFAPDVELASVGCVATALSRINAGPVPDIVLADLNLIGGSGCDLIAPLAGLVPVAILSTTADPRQRSRSLAAGAADFIVKPIRFADYLGLFTHVRSLAGR